MNVRTHIKQEHIKIRTQNSMYQSRSPMNSCVSLRVPEQKVSAEPEESRTEEYNLNGLSTSFAGLCQILHSLHSVLKDYLDLDEHVFR